MTFAHTSWDQAEARKLVERLKALDGALLPIFHALQDRFGHIAPEILPDIAEALNLSKADVHGVLTFYHDFRTSPPEGRIIRLCRAEACQALGSEALAAAAEAAGHVVETVYCLGNCALGPAAMVDGKLIGRLDADRLLALCGGTDPEAIREGGP